MPQSHIYSQHTIGSLIDQAIHSTGTAAIGNRNTLPYTSTVYIYANLYVGPKVNHFYELKIH